MTEDTVSALARELDELRRRNELAVRELEAARRKYRERRAGKSDLPVFPVETPE
jgi:hypothetical protein